MELSTESVNDLPTDPVNLSVANLIEEEEEERKQKPNETKPNDKKEANKTKPSFKQMTNRQRISYIKELITVEPLVACYICAATVALPALQNLELEKACRVNENFNDTVCDSILIGDHANYKEQNDRIQITISRMHSWQNPMQQVVPLLLILFLGSYSDRHKIRKPFLLIPIFGEFFAVAALILCVVFMRSWPVEVVGVAQTVVPSFFGGATTFLMAVFSYIADVSTIEMRTLRVAIVQIVLNVITPIMNPISAHLYEALGYIGSLVITGVFYAIGLCYGFFYIKEPKKAESVSKKKLLQDMFDPRHAIDTFKVLLKYQPGNDRLFIVLVLIIFFVSTAVAYGEFTLMFLFSQGVLEWTPTNFSYWYTGNIVIHLIGTAVGIPIFTKLFHLKDYTIIALSFLDKIISNIVFGFTKTTSIFYVATVVSVITSIATVALRSLITKLVTEDNLGKALSLFGICENIAGAVGVPVYNEGIYINTIATFPQAFFFVGSALFVGLTVIILFMYFKERIRERQEKNKQPEKNGNTQINTEAYQTTHM